MYRYLRNTHLLLGAFSFLFLMMYGASAVQMAHNSWFRTKPSVTENRIQLAAGPGADARALARELMDRHGLRGELSQVRAAAGGVNFRIMRPGTVYEVDYAAATGAAHVRTNVAGFAGMLNRIHHVAGVRHEYALLNVWGWFVGLISVFLIVLGVTGIYMWYKIHTRRLAGTILLAASLGFSLTLLISIRMA